MSESVTRSSGTALLTVYTSNPTGGVNSPASMARMPKIAKASGSIPKPMAMGANMGTVSNMIDAESRIILFNYKMTTFINTVLP